MAKLTEYMDENFDDTAIPASKGANPDPVPPGKYKLQLESGEMVHTKSGTGVMFKARFSILVGEHAGKALFGQMNVRNQNVTAQTIGIGEMKALAAAVGVPWEKAREETDLLLYKPFDADIGMEKENINQETGKPYPPRNRVVRYILKGSTPTEAVVNAKSTAVPKPKIQPAVSDDDIPF